MYKVSFNNRYLWVWGIMAVLLYMMPYFVLGENAYITIHDFLDSNVAHQSNVITLGLIGNPDGVLPVLDGVSSLYYMSLIPLDVKSLFYILFPTYWAIVFNTLFVKLGAFAGMFLLSNNFITKGDRLCSLLVAIVFSLIPFYVDYGWSSAGVPLFLYAACNLENDRKLFLSYIIIALFGINSSLNLSGFFICSLWVVWIIYSWISRRLLPKNHIYGLILLIVIYLFANISIIYNFFFPSDIISHRIEFQNTGTIKDDLFMFVGYLVNSQEHAGSFGAFVVLGIVLVLFINKWNNNDLRHYVALYLIIAILILIGCMVRYLPFVLFKAFQFDRFYFLYPTLCLVLLAKAFSLVDNSNRKLYLVILSIISLGAVLVNESELKINVRNLIGSTPSKSPSYAQFYDNELFSKIRKDLGSKKPCDIKVVCVGFFPSVAEMNLFYTLDSYVFSYSLDYKHKFRKVISKELDKSQKMQKYFDDWGSRCYIFCPDLNKYLCSKDDNISVDNLEIDSRALKELGCQYILSAVNIKNYKSLNLDYVGRYETIHSYWNIRVYKLV